jgi:hypothetical protein
MHIFRSHSRVIALVLAVVMANVVATNVRAQTPNEPQPIPSSPKDDLTAIQRLFSPPAPPPQTLFPEMRQELSDTPAFFRDSTFSINFRSYYRDNITNTPGTPTTINEAWAAGGSLAFETGKILDRLWGGAVFYTSLPIYAPLDRDGTGLLMPGQQGYDVVGQLYGRLRLFDDNIFTAGRYLYDTPFLGPHDNRMTPNTFGGFVLQGSYGDPASGPAIRYGGGFINEIKPRNADVFQSMARAAGANADYGTGLGGARLTWGPFEIGAIEYYTQDTLNIVYAEGKYGINLAPEVNAILALQYADQRSTGLNLLNGGNYFATDEFGAKIDLGYQTAILTLGFSSVNPGFQMQSPWNANPFYTDAQIQAFQHAGEQTFMAGLSYVFTPIGLKGVAASVFYFDAWADGVAAAVPIVENEWDFNLEWRPAWKPLPGLWFRARYGHSNTWQNNALTTVDEVRLILNYTVNLY